MVNKLLVLVCAAVLTMFLFSTFQEQDQGAGAPEKEAMARRSTNVVMIERSQKTGKTMEVKAREVVETDDRMVRFRDFLIEQDGGPQLSGDDATYDRRNSVLTIQGPVSLEAGDGATVHIEGLSWDRKKNEAHTDNPVSFEGWGGIVTAERAIFSEGFTRITLTGRVNAKIRQNILDL